MLHFEKVTEALYALAAAEDDIETAFVEIQDALTGGREDTEFLCSVARQSFDADERRFWRHFKPYYRIDRLKAYVEAVRKAVTPPVPTKRYELSLNSAEAYLINLLIENEDGNSEGRHNSSVFQSLSDKVSALIKQIG